MRRESQRTIAMCLARKSDKKVTPSVFGLLSETTTIHGVKYIGDHKSPRASRTFWICAFTLSILGCIYYAAQVYEKWYVTPDIGLKVEYKSSRSIPFPAITICPQNKVRTKVFNFSDAYTAVTHKNHSITDEERRYLEMMLQVCISGFSKEVNKSYIESPLLHNDDIIKLMDESQFEINETVLFGNIFGQSFLGNHFTTRVLTSDGYCMTFNLEDYDYIFRNGEEQLADSFSSYKSGKKSDYDMYQGYKHNEKEAYPRRILTGGKNAVVFILVQNKHDIDAVCRGTDTGFKVYWHMPNEIPIYWHRSILIPGSRAKKLIMKATRTRTSEDLLRYEVKQRRCYFEGERQLQFFKNYTKSHCDLECLATYMLRECNCVKFWMPRNTVTPLCNVSQLTCADDAENSWLENDNSYLNDVMPCDCYPACAGLKYDLLMNTEVEFNTNDTLKKFEDDGEFYNDFPTGEMSRLTIYFEDFLIEDQENYLGYKMQHFISDCGGLLGLFMGCSVLSLVELIYHTFAILFLRSKEINTDDQGKRTLTPMNDKKAIVIHEDDVVVVEAAK